MNRIRACNPVWFFKQSLSFMQGYGLWYILTRMPKAYAKYCYYTLFR